jgi:WD40 repeat protein
MLLAANRDGKRLAVSNGFTDTSVWDQATGAEIGSVATRPEAFAGIINSVALSGDGRRLALGGDFESLAVFDVVTGRTLFSPRPNPNRRVSGAPLAFALDDTGHRVAVAAENSTLTVYDVDSGRSLATRALSERAVVLAFSADSRLLATESADRVLQVWNGNTIEELARIPHTFDVVGLSLSDERLRVLRPDGSMVDVVWEPGRLIRAACTAIGRNFSPAEWVRYFSDETHRKTCAQL